MISENYKNKPLVEECTRLSIVDIDILDLSYNCVDVGNQTIGLTTSKCNFGGERVWFLCPACNKRIGVLYRPPLKQLFLCRQCHNLTYELRKYHRSKRESSLRDLRSFYR